MDVAGVSADAPHGHDDGVEAGCTGRVYDGDLDDLCGLAEPGGLGVEDQDVLAVQELAEGGPGFLLLTQAPATPGDREDDDEDDNRQGSFKHGCFIVDEGSRPTFPR